MKYHIFLLIFLYVHSVNLAYIDTWTHTADILTLAYLAERTLLILVSTFNLR